MTSAPIENISRIHAGAVPNGAAMAAILAAGIGAFAMGLLVVLHETGLFVSLTLYAPAGGLSGRTTFAVIVWLVAWGALHTRWNRRTVEAKSVFGLTLVLVTLGLLATFPPVWRVF